jgi:ATP-dependent protease ClpP protease subunit
MSKMPKTINLNIHGAIVDQDFWGMGLPTPQKVIDQIKDAGPGDQIAVHINSPGGNVFAGQAIHNILKQSLANVTVYIDGVAASIASVIAMAGNRVVMPPGTMMMIHNPLQLMLGGYFAGELRDTADYLDKIRDAMVATYQTKVKSKSREELIAIMDATTWLTAEDAVKSGFADEVLEIGAITASINGKTLNVAGMSFDLSPFATLPAFVNAAPIVSAVMQREPPAAPVKTINEEEKILDKKEFREKYPEVYNEIVADGVTQERTRMKALDDVALPGSEDLVNKARYETGSTAEQVAMQIIASAKEKGSKTLQVMAADAAELFPVGGAVAPADTKAQEEKERQALVDKMTAYANEGRGK